MRRRWLLILTMCALLFATGCGERQVVVPRTSGYGNMDEQPGPATSEGHSSTAYRFLKGQEPTVISAEQVANGFLLENNVVYSWKANYRDLVKSARSELEPQGFKDLFGGGVDTSNLLALTRGVGDEKEGVEILRDRYWQPSVREGIRRPSFAQERKGWVMVIVRPSK